MFCQTQKKPSVFISSLGQIMFLSKFVTFFTVVKVQVVATERDKKHNQMRGILVVNSRQPLFFYLSF